MPPTGGNCPHASRGQHLTNAQGEWTSCVELGCSSGSNRGASATERCQQGTAGAATGLPQVVGPQLHATCGHLWSGGGRALPGPRRGEAGVPGPQVRWGQGARGPEKPVGPQEPLGGSLHGAGRLLPASCRAAGPLRASELGCRAGGRSDFSPRERPPREQEQPSSVRLSEALTSRGEASRGSCALTPTRRDSQWAHADTQQTQTT